MDDQVTQNHSKKTVLSPTELPCLLWHKSGDYKCGFVFRSSVSFHWSIYISLCQYHIIFITVASYSLVSGIMSCSVLLQYCLGYSYFCISIYIFKLACHIPQIKKPPRIWLGLSWICRSKTARIDIFIILRFTIYLQSTHLFRSYLLSLKHVLKLSV